jgi:rRNA maturation protein Nop10
MGCRWVPQIERGTLVTTIRANCPSCGDVQLRAPDLTVRVCSDDEQGSYTFRCPSCAQAVAKDASRRIVDLLVSSGVRMEVWRLPAELSEQHVGPPISPDDLLDFHLLLGQPGWFDQVADLVRRSPSR